MLAIGQAIKDASEEIFGSLTNVFDLFESRVGATSLEIFLRYGKGVDTFHRS